MDEVWKDVEGFEGYYQVSNLGRVKSLPRFKRKSEKILTPTPNTVGYLIVTFNRDGKRTSPLVHRMVMKAFEPIDNADEMQVNHKDFDITNNCLSNLEWVTRQGNMNHFWNAVPEGYNNGYIGEKHHLSSINEDIVREIRKLSSEGMAKTVIGRMFGLCDTTVGQIVRRITWKHVL